MQRCNMCWISLDEQGQNLQPGHCTPASLAISTACSLEDTQALLRAAGATAHALSQRALVLILVSAGSELSHDGSLSCGCVTLVLENFHGQLRLDRCHVRGVLLQHCLEDLLKILVTESGRAMATSASAGRHAARQTPALRN